MKKIQFSKEQIKNILENTYLAVFMLFLAYNFLWTTMFEIDWPENTSAHIRILLISLILLRMGYSEQYTIKEMAICFILCVVSGVVFKRTGFEEVINTAILIIGAKGISFKKIIKAYLTVTVSLLMITVIAALTGVIENLVYTQEGRNIRIAFGFGYPTDFAAHIVYIVLAYSYLRREKITYLELAGVGGLGIFVYLFCQARLNSACLLLTMAVLAVYKIRCAYCKKTGTEIMGTGVSTLLAVVPVFCASAMLLLSMFFSPNNKLMLLLDKVLSYRLRLGKKGIDLYSFSFLGEWIPMQGNGGSVKEQVHYFFLDSSWLFVILQYGVVLFGIILAVITIVTFKAQKEKDWVLILLVALMAVQCVVEHHLMDMSYNPFLWAMMAKIGMNNTDKRGRLWKRKQA